MTSDTKDTGSAKVGESGGEALKTLLNARNVAPTDGPARRLVYETPKLRELAGDDLETAKAAIPGGTLHSPTDNHPLGDPTCHVDEAEEFPAPVDLPPPDVTPRVPDPEDLDLKEHPIKTVGRPLSELPRCSVCDKYVGSIFRVVDLHMGLVDQKAARQVAGIAFGFGLPLPLAELFSSHGDAVRITDDPRIDDRGYLCNDCFAASDLPLLQEKIHRAIDRAKAARR